MRIVSTILFLVITILMSVISIVFALIDRSGNAYLLLARLWGRLFLMLFGAKLEVSGVENLDTKSNYVFCANHSSYTDIPILFAGLPMYVRLILRRSLTRIPIWGWALLASPMIIIDRSNPTKAKRTLEQAADIIRSGASVLLFPEGTRTHTGEIQPFKRGAFHIAYQSRAEVVPVKITGAFKFLPRTERLPKIGTKLSVRIGKPLKIDDTISSDREREADLMRRTEEAIRA
jgi:1-acyl-sn-glycerol-3-phosphate acyltransferase